MGETEVGWYQTARLPVVVYREPEVGLMWMAEAQGLNHAALGKTPDEAVRNLFWGMGEARLPGEGYADDAKLKGLSR